MNTQPIPQPEPQTRANRIGNKIVYAALAVLAVAVGIFLFWSFQDGDVLEVKNTPVPVRTIREHPQADGVVILNVDYCKKLDATGRVRTSFVSDSREIFLPAGEDKQAPECGKREIPVIIPHDIAPDVYKVRFRIEYEVNPIKTVFEEFDSLPFEVVEGGEIKNVTPSQP